MGADGWADNVKILECNAESFYLVRASEGS